MIHINRKMQPYIKQYDQLGLLINPLPYYHPIEAHERDNAGGLTGRVIPFPNNHERRKAASIAGRKPKQTNFSRRRKKSK